ncbi:MAG: hypothetical protein QOI26_1935, partial [Pseudonocardiales bacterium]|nr:hypothetical protein [Pseudonocardiales bacterium]
PAGHDPAASAAPHSAAPDSAGLAALSLRPWECRVYRRTATPD